jgi:hypothetical protein
VARRLGKDGGEEEHPIDGVLGAGLHAEGRVTLMEPNAMQCEDNAAL